MELIRSLCNQFVDVMERHEYTRLFVYYANGTEIEDVDVLSFIVYDEKLAIVAGDRFGCIIEFPNVKTAFCETEPDGVIELSLYLVDGTEITIDTYA